MFKLKRVRIDWLVLAAAIAILGLPQAARSDAPSHFATAADLARLEKKVNDQQALVVRLIKLQQQYLQSVTALAGDLGATGDPLPDAPPPEATPPPAPGKKTVATKQDPAAKPPSSKATGTIVGKVKGAADAVVYLEIAGAPSHASATMKQEGKQFVPRVLVVQKGTRVDFPNRDAVFHNVFSVTPDNSFDLGSYRQGESKSVTLVKPGVVTVYCNMHPQMVGHVLVVPGAFYAQAGQDGFFKLANVPAGHHKIIAWAPNAAAVVGEVDVSDSEAATVELQIGPRSTGTHSNKEGLPYGSYKD